MKKGFTLVELLAVIVILAIISTITYGVISSNMKSTKLKSFEISSKNLLESAKEYVTKNMDNNDFPEGGIDVTSEALELKSSPFISGIVKRNDKGQIILVDVTDGNFCANGTKNDLNITEGTCESIDETAPELKVKLIKVGTTSAQIMVKTQDSGSGILKYELCLNENCKTYEKDLDKKLIKDVIKLSDLKPNTDYNIKVISTNGTDNEDIKTTSKEIKIKTVEIEEPTFSISSKTYATNKVLTIKYPKNDGNYEYTYIQYNIDSYGNRLDSGISVNVDNEITEVEIKNKIEVEAIIKRDGIEIISNNIIIDGIDVEGPNVNVVISDIDKWTKEKTLTFESNDTGVGLALRPYSFEDNTWVKESSKVVKTSITNLNIKSRDRLGNINKTYTINGSSVQCGVDTGKDICSINNIDSLEPDVQITVVEGNKLKASNNKEYYISDKIKVKIVVDEYYLLDGKKTKGGSGFDITNVPSSLEKNIKIKWNGNIVTAELKKAEESRLEYELIISENSKLESEVEVTATDNVGNVRVKKLPILIDRFTPVITVKNNPLNLGGGSYNFTNNLSIEYGPLGGSAVCDPAVSRGTGSYRTTCTITGNNGLTSTTSFNVNHSYPATYHKERRTRSVNCHEGYYCPCGTELKLVEAACGGVGCFTSGTKWVYECACSEQRGTFCDNEDYDYEYYTCDIDSSQVYLSGSTCYYR